MIGVNLVLITPTPLRLCVLLKWDHGGLGPGRTQESKGGMLGTRRLIGVKSLTKSKALKTRSLSELKAPWSQKFSRVKGRAESKGRRVKERPKSKGKMYPSLSPHTLTSRVMINAQR